MYDSINELSDRYDKKDIKNRVALEAETPDCRVFVLSDKSTIASKIATSNTMARFILDNYIELSQGKEILSKNINFESEDGDLYASFHSAGVKNCKMDENGNIKLQIVDFYNFNEGRTSVKGRVGRKLQEMDDVEPYYIIVDVNIPKDLVKRLYKL